MRTKHGRVGFLLVALSLALSACGQTRYVMPALKIDGGGVLQSPWADVELVVEQITTENLYRFPAYALRLPYGPKGRAALVPRVPLPAFALRIRNVGDEPLLLTDAKAWLTDAAGQRYEPLTNRDDIVRRVVDFARGRQPDLMSAAAGQWIRDAPDQSPAEALDTAARNTPIFGEPVEIPPRGAWSGAILLATDASHLETLLRTAQSARIVLHIAGAQRGAQVLPPFELAFAPRVETRGSLRCADGRVVDDPKACGDENAMEPIEGGTCLQEGARPIGKPWDPFKAARIDGHEVSTTDVSRVLLDYSGSRVHEKHAWALKVAGWVLVGGGAVGAVSTAGALGGTGHSRLAPAGLGMLGLSAIGLGVLTGGQREHRLAIREYNSFAFRSGFCARPR